MPDNQYKHNHYVPEWYQKRFLTEGNKKLYCLNLKPDIYRDRNGKVRGTGNELKYNTPKSFFAQDDLYTTTFNGVESRDIEKVFFGKIDTLGRSAIEFWDSYDHENPNWNGDALFNLMLYMSTQKLRTIKGLGWLKAVSQIATDNQTLNIMMMKRQLFGAIWTESIWQIADASDSATKLIISDHPVTAYNRELGPRNRRWCRGFNDPDIRMHGTHTLFPLSSNKILILTNLSWARNPYQSALGLRPNPIFERSAMFNFLQVQVRRRLSEEEVRQINFIIKSRALRYIAAENKDWLYPEKHVSKAEWNILGDGLLLQPDPRPLHYGGSMFMGYKDGSTMAVDAFGRKPWQENFEQDDNPARGGKHDPLDRIKGEFAFRFGPKRRGVSSDFGASVEEEDTPTTHEYFLSLDTRRLAQEKSWLNQTRRNQRDDYYRNRK